MIQGLRTLIYPVADLAKGKARYSELVDAPPYSDQPFYVGYSVEGFELGLIPDGTPGARGSRAYWGASDAAAEMARLQKMGAKVHEALNNVGEGIKAGAVLDPFGNVVGIIENPLFDPKKVR